MNAPYAFRDWLNVDDRPDLRPIRHKVVHPVWAIAVPAPRLAVLRHRSRIRVSALSRAIAIASVALALFTIAYFAAEMLRVTL